MSDRNHLTFEVLDQINDIELIVLKGHVLIEKSINQALEGLLPVRKKFKKLERFDFHGRLTILSCLFEFPDPMGFSYIKKFNTIRNKFAHELDSQKFHSLLIDWIVDVLHSDREKLRNDSKHFRYQLIEAISVQTMFFEGFNQDNLTH